VSVWSFHERRLLARCQGHSSWVTGVAFDPFGDQDGERVPGERRAGERDASGTASLSAGATRRLCFGSVGADTKLLLWELEVPLPVATALPPAPGAPSQVNVSHVRNGRTSDRAAAPNGMVTPRQSTLAAATSRIVRLPSAGSPKGPAPAGSQFSVQATTGATPSQPGLVARGESAKANANGGELRRRSSQGFVVPSLPLAAAPVINPVGGVAAHVEPVTSIAFAPGAILTTCLGGNIRIWVPRVPPGSAVSTESGAQLLTYNLISVQTTSQHTISASAKACYIDPALNAGPNNARNPRPSY